MLEYGLRSLESDATPGGDEVAKTKKPGPGPLVGGWLYIGDEILASYIGIIINHYKSQD